jgi:MAP kinase substrate 1
MAATSFDARHGAGSSGALGVHAASRKIGKQQERKPVIIYMVSPKVIHVEAHEFMPLVQRLTGRDSGGRGDSKGGRPSTPPGGKAAAGDRTAPAVRVKARALNRPAGAAVSVSVTANAPSAAPASPSGFMFHDLSPLHGAALKGDHPQLLSPGWMHHLGDHFFSAGAAAGLGSPSAGFLDIFGSLPSQQQ